MADSVQVISGAGRSASPDCVCEEPLGETPIREIAPTPEEVTGLRQILENPEPPTEALREAYAEYLQFATDNPSW